MKACAQGGYYTGGEELRGPPSALAERRKRALGKGMEAGQVPGEEGQRKQQCFKEDGCSGHQGSVILRLLLFYEAQKLQGKTSKDPGGSNMGNVVVTPWKTRGLPQCFGSVRDLAVCG